MDDAKFQTLSKPQQDVVMKIAIEAERQGVNPKLAIAIAEAETGGAFSHVRGDKVLTSPAGARGVMQIMPDTARLFSKKYGIDINPDDEDSNIMGGVTILKDLLTNYKSPRNAVALYNASPRAVANFMKLYQTDPDKAILSLPEETQNYSLRVSRNFNLDDDKETGLISAQNSSEPAKEGNPNDPFAAGVPLADKAREASILEAQRKAAEEEERKNNPPPTTLLEKASEFANEINPALAGVVGAVANVAGPSFSKPILSPAEEAYKSAQDKLELARRNLDAAYPRPDDEPPMSRPNFEDEYRQSQSEMERIKNEQRLAEARLAGLPRNAPVIETPAPSSLISQIDLTRTGPASGPKIEGDSAARNWTIKTAGQKHQMPEAVLDAVTDQTSESKTGGMRLIRDDLANIEKIKQLGAGDFDLVTTEGGVQLQLPPATVAERRAEIEQQNQANQAELEQRAEQARLQQQAQAQQLEQQRLAYEADLERLREERRMTGQRLNEISGQIKTVTPLKKAVTKAEVDAELAQRKLKRAPEPTTPVGRAALNAGKTTGRTVVGGLAGVGGVMSLQEALERFKAGDTSEGVLKTIQASSAAAMLVPPVNKTLSGTRKLGALGAIGSYGYDFGRELFRKNPQEAK